MEGSTKDKEYKRSKRMRYKKETENRKEIMRQTKATAAEDRK